MPLNVQELHNGPATAGELYGFTVEETGTVIVSDQNLDGANYSCDLMILRREVSNDNLDYVQMAPTIPLDNGNNYQVLGPGSYAVRVSTAADIIVTVIK